jgi:formylglycine-generating enzyme required for sulfatase activity
MILTGQQKEILKDGILGAYPSENDLEILLLEKMGLSYSAKARGDNYANRVAYLVIQLQADGELEQLIQVIGENKPNSPYLTGFRNILTPGAVEQFREKVREYLSDRKLEEYEKEILNLLRDELGLSPEKADQILEEELAPIRQAQQAYRLRLNALIKYYPFNEAIKGELKKFQAQRNLTDEEVDEISRPILEQAKITYSLSQLDKVQQAQPQREQEKVRKRSRPQETLEPQLAEDLGKGVSLDMVRIPGGTFQMGSPVGQGDDNERPQHFVTVPSFFMGKYPITQAQWRAVADLPQVTISLDPEPSHFKGDSRPVEQVSWHEAVEFCQRISSFTGHQYRLPSEAEWEYACRAGTTTPFHFGETLTPRLARCKANIAMALITIFNGETAPVGSYSPNAFGLYDMHGNVREWCADHCHENYASAPTDSSAWITGGHCETRQSRGGSWSDYSSICRSASRNGSYPPAVGQNYIGFRIVCAQKTLSV